MRVYKVKTPYNDHLLELRPGIIENGEFQPKKDVQDKILNKLRDIPRRSLRETWEPYAVLPIVGYEGSPVADFSYLCHSRPIAITQRVKDALGDLLDSFAEDAMSTYGELLPLKGADGNNYYIHHTPYIDALDEANSVTSGSEIAVHTFHIDKLSEAGVFKLPQLRGGKFFVTEQFKQRVEEYGFTNLPLLLIWDSKNPDFFDERYTEERWLRLKAKLADKKMLKKVYDTNQKQDIHSSPPIAKKIGNPLNDKDREAVKAMAQAAVSMLNDRESLNLTPEKDTQLLVESLFTASETLRHQSTPQEELENRAIELGVLWGEQVVRAYGWHWAKIDGEFAVVAPDASLYVFPVPFAYQFFEEPQKDSTLLLLFNMLANPKTDAKPGDYVLIG